MVKKGLRRSALAIMVGCVAFAAAGCGGDDEASSATSASSGGEKQKLVLSLGAFTVTYPELFVADQLGFFDELGLDVDIQNNGTNFATVLLGGRADLAVSSPPGAFAPVEQGKDTVVVGELTRSLPLGLIVKQDSPFKTLEDLSGKRMVTFSPGTGFFGISTVTSDFVKEATGKGITLTQGSSTSGDFSSQVASGSVDSAYANPEGAVPFLKANRVRWLLEPGSDKLDELLPNDLVGYSLYGLRDRVASKKDAIARLLAGVRRGNAWVRDHSDEELTEVLSNVPGFDAFKPDDLLEAVRYGRKYLPMDDGKITAERWDKVSVPVWESWQTGVDVTGADFSFEKRVDMSYFEASESLDDDAAQ